MKFIENNVALTKQQRKQIEEQINQLGERITQHIISVELINLSRNS